MMTLVDSKLSPEKRGFLHATTRIFIPALQTVHDEKRFPWQLTIKEPFVRRGFVYLR